MNIPSLPLLGKPFIEAPSPASSSSAPPPHRFPFWGSPSLRLVAHDTSLELEGLSLPLLGKPFIEATTPPPHGTPSNKSLPLLGKPFIEARTAVSGPTCATESLPLLGKPFIEARGAPRSGSTAPWDRFPFWGSPSLRQAAHGRRADRILRPSLPLLGKPFIEAGQVQVQAPDERASLPLLGKPFIEAGTGPAGAWYWPRSLPLLGKPFIEAPVRTPSPRRSGRIASPSGEALH